MPDPASAPAVREAFALCAQGVIGAALVQRMRELELRTPKGFPVCRSRLYTMLRAPVYAGIIRIAKWSKEERGDFEPLVDAKTFGLVQARLSRPTPAPLSVRAEARRTRNARDEMFPLRRFMTCAVCGRAISGSLSRGRTGVQYPFYHCAQGCTRLPKAKLEQQFIDLLDQLRPDPVMWKILEAHVLRAWRKEKDDAGAAAAIARQRLTQLQNKGRRLDELFIDQNAIDRETYHRRRQELQEEMAFETLRANGEHDAALDVDGLLSFAEHAMTHAGALWSAETCTRRRVGLQWTLFPAGLQLENGRVRTALTCLGFFGLLPRSPEELEMVDLPATTWKQVVAWLTAVGTYKAA